MPSPQTSIEIFYAYAHKDEQLLHELEKHLSLLRQQGLINAWHDRHILPGMDWARTIDTHLERVLIVLLLISSDFLASDYCYGVEMKRALERDQAKEARVIPILLRPVDWQNAPFKHLQVLPTGAKAITTWNNQDEAFVDVAAGIRRAIEDLMLQRASSDRVSFLSHEEYLHFPAAFPAIWNVPYRHKDYFTGREDILQQIHETFAITSLTSPIIAISGPGGMGKTQTAAEYAYAYRSDYQCVLWIKAETSTTLTSDVATTARLLSLPESSGHDQRQTIPSLKTWLREHPHWLLVLDNADDLTIANDVLPEAGRGHILVTTRALSFGGLGKNFVLDKLSAETGALFVLRRAGLIDSAASREATTAEKYAVAQQISERLGGLPLALEQAGAYIEDTACGLPRYLKLYQTRSNEIQRLRFGPLPDYPESVATAWTLSRALVQARNPAAADLLRFCAFLYPEAIPEVIFTEGASELGPLLQPVVTDSIQLDLALSELRKFALISRSSDTETLSMHRLLQDIQKAELTQEEQRAWAQSVVRAVNKAVQASPASPLHRARDLDVQAQACMALIQQWNMRFSEAEQLRQWLEMRSL